FPSGHSRLHVVHDCMCHDLEGNAGQVFKVGGMHGSALGTRHYARCTTSAGGLTGGYAAVPGLVFECGLAHVGVSRCMNLEPTVPQLCQEKRVIGHTFSKCVILGRILV